MAFRLNSAETDPRGLVRVEFRGRASINRKDWGATWNAVLEGGGVLVGETVTLEFDITAIRQS